MHPRWSRWRCHLSLEHPVVNLVLNLLVPPLALGALVVLLLFRVVEPLLVEVRESLKELRAWLSSR